MSQPNKEHAIITAAEYFMMQERNQSYQGYVVYPNGEVTFALSEVVIESTPSDFDFNRYTKFALSTGIKYHETPTPYICETDNIHVDRENLVLKTKASNENYFIRRRVKDELLNSIKQSFRTQNNSNAEIDVGNPKGGTQIAFSKLKFKIEDEAIKREDLYKYGHLKSNCIREIDTYFACFDPKDANYRQFWNMSYMPKGAETYIPAVGNLMMAEEYFVRGFEGRGGWNYCYGVGHFLFGVADGISLGMLTGVGGPVVVPISPISTAYFPKIRNGWGVFGEKGLNIGSYKIEAMYQHKTGGGSIFSIEGGKARLKNFIRIDYNKHKEYPEAFWHYHYRYTIGNKTYGSTRPRPF